MVRFRVPGAARRSGDQPRHRLRRARRVPVVHVGAGAAHDLPADPQAAAGARAGARCARHAHLAVLVARIPAEDPDRRGRGGARSPPPADRSGPQAPDQRGAARRVSERRRRLERGGGDHGRPDRRSRSRPLRSASTIRASTSCRTRDGSPSRYGCDHHEFEVRPRAIEVLPSLVRHYGEPVRRLVGDSELLSRQADAPARDRRPQRRRRRRGVRRLRLAPRQPPRRTVAAGAGRRCAASPNRSARASRRCRRNRRSPIARLSRFMSAASRPRAARYREWLSVFTADLKREMYVAAASDGRRSARGDLRRRPVARRRGCDAARRHRVVPADGPAGEDGHRDDGQFARGAVAVPRLAPRRSSPRSCRAR